jgi:RNA recognition motif-containing protein
MEEITNTIQVSNLSKTITEKALHELFLPFGRANKVTLNQLKFPILSKQSSEFMRLSNSRMKRT